MSEIVHIPFHGDDLMAVDRHGRPHVVLKPAFEAIGLDADQQIRKVQRQPWATTGVTTVVAADGRVRDMVTADVRTFLMALATIPTSRVAEQARTKLVAYQSEVADVIEAYWTTGRVANPRLSDEGYFEPHTLTYDEVCGLLRQRFGMVYTVPLLCRTLRSAGVLKQNGSPTKKYAHFLWFTGTAWNVHPHMVAELAGRVNEATHQIQAERFLAAQLAIDGMGVQPLEPDRHRLTP